MILAKFENQREKMYLVLQTMFPNETIERPAKSKAAVRFIRAVHSREWGHADSKKDGGAFIKI